MLRPRGWLNERVLVFFFDPIRLSLAPTNPDEKGVGRGFEITFPKAWVAKIRYLPVHGELAVAKKSG